MTGYIYSLCIASASGEAVEAARYNTLEGRNFSMQADYVLTTFSPAMFGTGATAHIKIVEAE